MPEASPRSSSDVLPAKVSITWGSTVLDVRHLSPGSRWDVHDFRVEATKEGTRVLAGDEVLLAAGVGERVRKTVGGLDVTIEPPQETERVRHDARELDVRFFKITAIAVMIFFALVASFILTPLEGMTDGDIFGAVPVKLTIVVPPEKTVAKKNPEFDKKPPEQNAQQALLQPKMPVDRQQKKANDRAKVSNLMASLFGNSFSKVLSGGTNNAIDQGLNNLKGPGEGASAADGLSGMDSRGGGPGGPAGNGLSIGGLGGPGRPNGSPTGFGLNPVKKQTFVPGDGPRTVVGDGLPRDVVMAVIRRHQSEIKHCYERELQQNAKLAGKIAVSWTIDATGSIADAVVAESGIDNANVEACMLERIRRWKFPEPKGGGVVVITFPWVFHAAGSEE
ncbi:MAG: AgmX/PglI C-terminal domain-containing protein [Myxococcales bacterium]|nr:AgmX/PglI C-terminal domain-containing protein [Myxococcales bacterium]MDP3501433.1 AgmX/PglI C-terminal domain-containing protein [Myxococcales bacterium]